MAFWLQRIFPLLLITLSFGAVPQRWESMQSVELHGSKSEDDITNVESLQHDQSTPSLPFASQLNMIFQTAPESIAPAIKARTNENTCCTSLQSQINGMETSLRKKI